MIFVGLLLAVTHFTICALIFVSVGLIKMDSNLPDFNVGVRTMGMVYRLLSLSSECCKYGTVATISISVSCRGCGLDCLFAKAPVGVIPKVSR
jgi:hypothetical protein